MTNHHHCALIDNTISIIGRLNIRPDFGRMVPIFRALPRPFLSEILPEIKVQTPFFFPRSLVFSDKNHKIRD